LFRDDFDKKRIGKVFLPIVVVVVVEVVVVEKVIL